MSDFENVFRGAQRGTSRSTPTIYDRRFHLTIETFTSTVMP
jgi:hypothetical protein